MGFLVRKPDNFIKTVVGIKIITTQTSLLNYDLWKTHHRRLCWTLSADLTRSPMFNWISVCKLPLMFLDADVNKDRQRVSCCPLGFAENFKLISPIKLVQSEINPTEIALVLCYASEEVLCRAYSRAVLCFYVPFTAGLTCERFIN
ncbi:hypothetical protein CEXT_44961 [Caerostris extrusa]|uniref:Uncharacterized protein n=1 Tax=Caerostris extrusa TaxID=172846 RepID=A0AAV4TR39_CAEEX|nr:hypothetical protein CEXT_44961 [Caerostris extrusa]